MVSLASYLLNGFYSYQDVSQKLATVFNTGKCLYKVQYVRIIRIWIWISGYPNFSANLDRIKGHYPILSYPFTSLITTKHRFAPSMFFQPAKNASQLKAAKVIASYLAVLPPEPAAAERNSW